MLPDELTITLGGRDGRVSIDALKAALANALEMLRNLETEFTAAGTEVRWEIVRVRMRSPLRVTVMPLVKARSGKAIGRRIMDACLQGMGRIENTSAVPEHFNDNALRAAKELATVGQKEGTTVSLGSNGKHRVTLTENTVRHIDEVVSRLPRYRDVSTIEGVLEVVSVRGHPSFFISEMLTKNKVECIVPRENLEKYADLLEKRVAVTGHVQYVNHIPKKIDVEELRILASEDEAIGPNQIGPINLTNGVPSEEHVRSMRNG